MKRREEGGGVEWRRGECIQCYPKMYVCKAARNTDISDTSCEGLVLRNYYTRSNASKQAYDLLTCLRIASRLSDCGVCPDLVCGALAT